MNDLKNFKIPDSSQERQKNNLSALDVFPNSEQKKNTHETSFIFEKKRFSSSFIFMTSFLASIKKHLKRGEKIEVFNKLTKQAIFSDHLNSTLTIFLIVILVFTWQWGFPMLAEADQLKNDLKEQAQVIKMEKSNQLSLKRLSEDQKNLSENIQKVYQALPLEDEKSEAVISMLEDMATNNRIVIDAIGIRQIPETQLSYEDLKGYVSVYEYSFTIESELPNILSFIASIRNSLRLMDIMAMEIEEKDGIYRAGFVLNAYHLSNKQYLNNE